MDDWLLSVFESGNSERDQDLDHKGEGYTHYKSTSKDEELELLGHPQFTLYCYPYSFYSQKVRMIIYEKLLPIHEHIINIHKGEQFTDSFLNLNPRGEVPVLKDRETHEIISDSENITNYLEEKFDGIARIKKLIPKAPEWKERNEQLYSKIHGINVESLTFGTAMFTSSDLGISPQHPYNNEKVREQMRELVKHRSTILRTEALRAKDSDPQVYLALTQKLTEVENETPRMRDREEFEKLVSEVERILDEIEMELRLQYRKDPKFWLICPSITQADVSFAILLFRLWQLGFSNRMWEQGKRKYIKRYFKRMREVESFQKVTQLEKENSGWLYFVGAVGVALIIVTGIYMNKKK